MQKHKQSLFLIERIQSTWLPGFFSQFFYRLLLILVLATGWMLYAFIAGQIEGMFIGVWLGSSSVRLSGFLGCIIGDPCPSDLEALLILLENSPIMAGMIGLMGGAAFAIPLALTSRRTILFEDWGFSWSNLLRGLTFGMVLGLLTIILMSSTWYQITTNTLINSIYLRIGVRYPEGSPESLLYGTLLIALFYGPVFVFTGSLIAGATYGLTFIVRKLRSNLQEFGRLLIVGGIIGMLSGMTAQVMFSLQYAPGPNLSLGLLVITIMSSMFVSAVMTGFSVELIPDSKIRSRRPNLGVWQAIIRSTGVMAIGLFVVIIVLALFIPWSMLENVQVRMHRVYEAYILALITSHLIYIAFLPPVFGTIYGGLAVVQHFAIRVVLALADYLPVELSNFLEDACNMGILQRVGGGYQFRHQLLMEHFANSNQKR